MLDSMRTLKQFARGRSGAAAVEFALVSSFLFLTIAFVMVVALIIYQNEALDFATGKAARQIMTGQVQQGSINQPAFRTQVLCPYLPAAMSCGKVIINVQTVAQGMQPNGYYTLVNAGVTALNLPALIVDAGAYTVGGAGAYQYLQVIYPVTFIPGVFARILGGGATYGGSPAFLLVSTATFKNELYN